MMRKDSPAGTPISPREMQFMRAYAQTGSMKAAAAQLGVKENTAKNHCSNVYSKLGAFGLVDALRILGWLHVPED